MSTLTSPGAPGAGAPPQAELLDRATALKPLIAARARHGETERRLADEVVAELGDAGLFTLGVPKRFGGHEAPMRTWLEVCGTIAEADGGAAWVTTLFNAGAFSAGLFPEQAQEEVFGADPAARVSGILSPTARTRKVEGGWQVTGRWYYASGAWHATWAAVGIPITDEAGESVDQGMALVPRGDFTVEDTWFTTGMRGSGSACIVVEDIFVPEHRVVSVVDGLAGRNVDEYPDAGLFKSNLASVLSLVLIGAQLGMARAALELVRSKADTKSVPYTFYARQADSAGFQLQLAEAAMRIDTAHLHAYRAADDVDTAAAAGQHLDMLVRARVRADVGYVAEQVGRALDILISAHGAASFAESSVLQRIWRDANTAARHGVVASAVGYAAYGQLLSGVEQQITPLI
ncbi:acyl-CoA dehydrogenase family protein [Streptomyces sp. NPDC050439]|uniref:acyl-CoA dehydrogenase family protein n=1 Tax=unclassified Streptomyces TaxID=2593676 RepID=UPI00341CBE02